MDCVRGPVEGDAEGGFGGHVGWINVGDWPSFCGELRRWFSWTQT